MDEADKVGIDFIQIFRDWSLSFLFKARALCNTTMSTEKKRGLVMNEYSYLSIVCFCNIKMRIEACDATYVCKLGMHSI